MENAMDSKSSPTFAQIYKSCFIGKMLMKTLLRAVHVKVPWAV